MVVVESRQAAGAALPEAVIREALPFEPQRLRWLLLPSGFTARIAANKLAVAAPSWGSPERPTFLRFLCSSVA